MGWLGEVFDGGIGQNSPRVRLRFYWNRFGKYALSHRKVGILAVVLIFGTSLLLMPAPLITKYIIDEVLTGRSRYSIESIGLGILVLLPLAAWVGYISQILSARFRERVTADIEADLFGHACTLPYSYHASHKPGYLASRISGDVQSLHGLMAETVAGALGDISTFVFGTIVIFMLEPVLATICLATIPLLLLLIRVQSRAVKATSDAMREESGKTWGVLNDGLSDILNLKLLTANRFFHERFVGSLTSRIEAALANVTAHARYGAGMGIFFGFANTLVLVYGGRLVLRGEMTLGGLVAFSAYLGFVFNPVRTVANMFGNLQVSIVCMDRILEIMDRESEGSNCPDLEPPTLTQGIRVRGLHYQYPDGQGGIDNVDFDILPGEKVAFVGRNGSGKTTAAMALVKLYNPDRGEIEIDGRRYDSIHPDALRKSILIVPQQPVLFEGSILDNIICGHDISGRPELERICALAGVDEILESKQAGLHTDIGPRGRRLSGGERQKVALARALIRKPQLLVLDETTSEMDAQSDVRINRSLVEHRRDFALLVISHRMANVMDADRIYVFGSGRVVAAGSHDDLYSTCGIYKDLFDRRHAGDSQAQR